SRGSRSSSVPWVAAVGVRYQVAPSKRSSRACSTPAASEPASGWPPTKRGLPAAPTTVGVVQPTAGTTHARGACACGGGGGGGRGRGVGAAGRGLMGARVDPAHRGAEPRGGGQADRAAD